MTPTQLVQNEIARFLSTKDPEVLCVSGAWGIGKTFTWQKLLDQAVEDKRLEVGKYSYVSLFGINSLEGLKLATVQNFEFLLPEQAEKLSDSLKKFGNNLFDWGWKSKDIAAELPYIGDIIKSAGPLFFSAVRNQIVCIDDLERRSADLSVKDVLGLISFLKEQRKCKVVLLLNDDELGEDGEKEFENYFEKVVDIALKFAPEPEDSVRIALPGTDPASQLIGENCIALGISNIRVIKKIERFVRIVQPLLATFNENIFCQAVRSLTLLMWSKYQPGSAPPLDYLRAKKERDYFGLTSAEDIPAEEAAWNALLDAYSFTWMDEFDFALLKGVENGYFDPEQIKKCATELDRKIELQKQGGSFEDAWRTFHDSFHDNQDEVLDTIYASFKNSVQSITPLNLNGSVTLFKDLGRKQQAEDMIEFYVDERKEESEFWDLDKYAFAEDVTDPDIVKAFNDKLETFTEEIDPATVLLKIAARDSWDSHDLAVLAALPSDEYYGIFKAKTGRELAKMISAALQFDKIANPSPPMQEISRRAKEALTQIGRESDLNARRVRKFGIKVD